MRLVFPCQHGIRISPFPCRSSTRGDPMRVSPTCQPSNEHSPYLEPQLGRKIGEEGERAGCRFHGCFWCSCSRRGVVVHGSSTSNRRGQRRRHWQLGHSHRDSWAGWAGHAAELGPTRLLALGIEPKPGHLRQDSSHFLVLCHGVKYPHRDYGRPSQTSSMGLRLRMFCSGARRPRKWHSLIFSRFGTF